MPVAVRIASPTGSVWGSRSSGSPAGGAGFGAARGDGGRFSLRLPGRELGRFPSTPSSSVIGKESSPRRSGYSRHIGRSKCLVTYPRRGQAPQVWPRAYPLGPTGVDDLLVDWLVGANSALGRLTSLSVALVWW